MLALYVGPTSVTVCSEACMCATVFTLNTEIMALCDSCYIIRLLLLQFGLLYVCLVIWVRPIS